MTTPKAEDVMRFADAIMAEIEHDMTVGFPWGKKLPRTVASFSELHDYCDANMYVITALEGAFPRRDEDEDETPVIGGGPSMFSDAETDMANAVMDEVNRRLALQNTPQHWCQTCGNETQGPDQSCVCWTLLAGALQQFLGMDHDGSADVAARMWNDLDPEEKQRVWSADYAEDHFYGETQVAGQPIRTYPDTRNYASAELREQDAKAFPHDEDCPNCGRRQWGLGADVVDPMNPSDAEQETCGACGRNFSEESA